MSLLGAAIAWVPGWPVTLPLYCCQLTTLLVMAGMNADSAGTPDVPHRHVVIAAALPSGDLLPGHALGAGLPQRRHDAARGLGAVGMRDQVSDDEAAQRRADGEPESGNSHTMVPPAAVVVAALLLLPLALVLDPPTVSGSTCRNTARLNPHAARAAAGAAGS